MDGAPSGSLIAANARELLSGMEGKKRLPAGRLRVIRPRVQCTGAGQERKPDRSDNSQTERERQAIKVQCRMQ